MDSRQFAALFPLGSHLCRQPMPPMSEMKRDMETLKRYGFNLVKLQEHWAWDEPREGVYEFGPYEELIAHAATLDMGVYLGLTCEQAPNWLWEKHSECRMIGRNGQPIAYQAQQTMPCDGKPGPCYDHPGALKDQARFIGHLVRTLGRYENLVLWNTWQEVGYWADWIVGQQVCYCDNTLAFFRTWLQERYGDLDGLNRAWGTRYADWQYVQPDRSARGRECLPQDIDWQYFMENVQISRVLQRRAAAIRAADPLGRPVFAHKGAPQIGSGQDWSLARSQDFLGSSAYPAWFVTHKWDDEYPAKKRYDRAVALLNETWDSVALRFDYIRACNRAGAPVWAAEFQGGPVSTGFHKGRVPSPEDMRRWMLTAVGTGVTAISFWVTRVEIMASEVNGFGLLDSTGDTTPRLQEAARIGEALNTEPDLFGQPSWPQAPVAILIDEGNYQFTAAMTQGGEHLPYAVRGWHRLLWDAGIPVDFITPDDLPASGHQVVVVPFPLSMSEEVAGKLTRYVEGGGHVISEACPGRMNEHAFCNRGELSPTMAALFGVRQESFTMVREPEDGERWSPPERTWGEYLDYAPLQGDGPLAGFQVSPNLYVETLTCQEGTTPILRHGDAVAGVMRRVGTGTAWLMGTFVGHNGTAYRQAGTREYILALLAQCGVRPAHQGKLLLRKRVQGDAEAWLFTNPTAEPITERVDIAGWGSVRDLLGGELHRTNDAIMLTVDALDVRGLVLHR